MLLLTLGFRSLFRHKRKTFLFGLLLTFSSLAIYLGLNFAYSFQQKYTQAGIDLATGHLAILRNDHPALKQSGFSLVNKNDAYIFTYNEDLIRAIKSNNSVSALSPVLELRGFVYDIDGNYDNAENIRGIPAEGIASVFPHLKADYFKEIKNGNYPFVRIHPDDLWWSEPEKKMELYNVLIDEPEFWESWPRFVEDFPALKVSPESLEEAVDSFNQLLSRRDFSSLIPERFFEEYSWELDDAVTEAEGEEDDEYVIVRNRTILSCLYPDVFSQPRKWPRLNVPMTFLTSDLDEKTGSIESQKVLPIYFSAYTEYLPLFDYRYNYISLHVLQDLLNLNNDQVNRIHIKVNSVDDVPGVKSHVQELLDSTYPHLSVADYNELGSMHLSVGTAITVIVYAINGLFLVIIAIFSINVTVSALIERRREIGTITAIGLEIEKSVVMLVIEIGLLAFISWFTGTIAGVFVTDILSNSGVPGLPFFPNGMTPVFNTYILAIPGFVSIVLVTLISAYIPCRSLLKPEVSDLLREAGA